MLRERPQGGRSLVEELARRVGTTKSVISRLEAGRHQPNVATLHRIAEAVGARLVISFE